MKDRLLNIAGVGFSGKLEASLCPDYRRRREYFMLREAKIDEKAKTITLVLDMQESTPSSSGKTLVVASTHGNVPTDVEINDKPVIVGVNAYIRAK